MDGGSALRDDGTGALDAPGWAEVRQAVMAAADKCAAAADALAMRGSRDIHAVLMVRRAAGGLRDISAQLRPLVFDEAVIEAERARAAEDALAAAGMVVPPQVRRTRHLHVVS